MSVIPTFLGAPKNAATRIAANLFYWSGMLNFVAHRKSRRATASAKKTHGYPYAVLLYHRINPEIDPFFPGFTTDVFEAQMTYISRHFRVLPLGEIVKRVKAGTFIEPFTIAITFDDGYRDNWLYAAPILKKHGLPATLFVASGLIGTNHLMWNDKVAWAVKHTNKSNYRFDIDGEIREVDFSTSQDRLQFVNEALDRMKRLSDAEKAARVERLVGDLGKEPMPYRRLMLSWDELRDMAQSGWEIGSHTVNHKIVTRVSIAEAEREIALSKQMLESKLRRQIDLFAYPNGKAQDFDVEVQNTLRKAGYCAAVTTFDGLNDSSTDLFELRRHSVWEEHLPSFATKMQWSYLKASEPLTH